MARRPPAPGSMTVDPSPVLLFLVCGPRFTIWTAPRSASLSGFCPRACFRRIAPATCATTYRWRPLETVTNRSVRMGCGPNVDHPRSSLLPADGSSAEAACLLSVLCGYEQRYACRPRPWCNARPGTAPAQGWAKPEGVKMRKVALIIAGGLALAVTQLLGPAAAQEAPLCGPPEDQVPATIVGSGTIVGTAGDDVIVGSDENDTILGLGGNDIICAEGGNDRVLGGEGDDVLIGDGFDDPPFIPSNGQNDDVLIGGPGDDVLAGLGGDDTMLGGTGNDELIGFGGNDRIQGGPGDDTAFGGPLDDRVAGNEGNDTLWGNFGSDTISGGPGDDFIDGDNPFAPPPVLPLPPGTNNDVCTGGPGEDQVNNCEVAS